MERLNKRMAIDLIEDALTNTDSAHGCGLATGLCGGFYMVGLITAEEWEAFLKRIPAEPHLFESCVSTSVSNTLH